MTLKGQDLEMDVIRDGLVRAGILMVFDEIDGLAAYEEHYAD